MRRERNLQNLRRFPTAAIRVECSEQPVRALTRRSHCVRCCICIRLVPDLLRPVFLGAVPEAAPPKAVTRHAPAKLNGAADHSGGTSAQENESASRHWTNGVFSIISQEVSMTVKRATTLPQGMIEVHAHLQHGRQGAEYMDHAIDL